MEIGHWTFVINPPRKMLNSAQRQAVETIAGPIRILAGAGTGKTHTLIARIGYLIELHKIDPSKILALTFTNKAARELNERLNKLKFPGVQTMTLHALAARLLRQFWRSDFVIIGKTEQEALLAPLLTGHEADKMETILSDIELIDFETPKSGLSNLRLDVIVKAYKKALVQHNSLDFSGLLTTLLDIWQENPDILEKSQAHFHYIMVDEYQDVNGPQIQIAQKLAEGHKNLCVVGDPDQTIYSWRGSDIKSMADFPLTNHGCTLITLTENYRNPPNILKGAENLIAHNADRLPKTLQSMALKQGEISLWKNSDEATQFETMAHLLQYYLGSHSLMHEADNLDTGHERVFLKLSDIAILYRTQAEGKRIAVELTKRGYPYQLSAPEVFWERKEIVDFLLNLEKLRFLRVYPENMTFSKWLADRIDHFIESNNWSEHQVKQLNSLLNYAVIYNSLPIQDALFEFLDEARTEQEIDNLIEADRINLLTLHAAKGLEFPIVMIVGLEDDNIPLKKSIKDPEMLAEERRLLYVGMTRATKDLHLFFCDQKFTEIKTPSRFLDEIGYTNMIFGKLPDAKVQSIRRKQITKSQMQLF